MQRKRKEAWDHTAAILCMLYNANRGPHSPKYGIEKFHPLRDVVKKDQKMVNEELSEMYTKKIFQNLANMGFGKYTERPKQ